ncbi:hypothetical protein KYC5002_04230 [Archangium violaceum]|uniref:hypothetical protein n=1 Tax=Archangium violaceum TaxID=83451 RepID=UPI002B285246|nr:hypothetical protein KYC5002_04230 [Archangium gephyra]
MPNTFSDVEALTRSIANRWGIIDWNRHFGWWRPPSKVRILMYADSSVYFNGGSFLGLQYVFNLLKSRAYYYVDFEIDFAHRDGTDPTATIPGAQALTSATLDIMNKYDEVWFFGFDSIPNLSPAEVTLMEQFMAAPKFGGVLVTGDHADLGKGIASQLPRAGVMRLYPAPPNSPPGWNTTLEEGPDANATFNFDDQSDDKPQTIRYKRYSLDSLAVFRRRYRPHPVLCGPTGPIDVFPDHQHEGEALAPVPAPGDPVWPTKAGHQEQPEVIAWGRIKDPAATKYNQEIGVLSAYNGHNVDVGRIIADSTWHHWFDINLTGTLAPPSPYAGFDETAAGQAALKKIDAFFLNCGVWLAPPVRQAEMRAAGWWSILWTDHMLELPQQESLRYYGDQAIDALGRRASPCTVTEWVLDLPIFKEKIPRWEWPMVLERFQLIDIPLERYVAGGILQQLMNTIGPWSPKATFPTRPVSDELLHREIATGIDAGLSALTKQLQSEASLAAKFADSGFQVRRILK